MSQYNGYIDYQYASGGDVFLEVNMTIKNNGYESFKASVDQFYAVADDVWYSVFPLTSVFSGWTTIEIPNGGTFTGALLFEVPEHSDVSGVEFADLENQNYNIVWWQIANFPVVTSEQTPSPPALNPYEPESTPTQLHSYSPTQTGTPNSGNLAVILALAAILVSVACVVALLLYVRHLKKSIIKQSV